MAGVDIGGVHRDAQGNINLAASCTAVRDVVTNVPCRTSAMPWKIAPRV